MPIPPRDSLLPYVDILGPVQNDIKDAVARRLGAETGKRYAEYLRATRLGIVAILGFAGSANTELLALTARLFIGT
jgi:hypothetical protein